MGKGKIKLEKVPVGVKLVSGTGQEHAVAGVKIYSGPPLIVMR